MDQNNNDKHSLELSQMKVQAELMKSLDSALEMVTKLNEAVIYLDFENPPMIQRYYDAITSSTEGFQGLKVGFKYLAESYGINLVEEEY